MEPTPQESGTPTRRVQLGLWDTICIMIGIIIGTGIYRVPGEVFSLVDGPKQALALWIAGGVLAIAGAMCFAELASTYPRSGGEYVYLTRAFGSWAGFLFAWGQLLFIRTGASMVMMAYIFADYMSRLVRLEDSTPNYASIYIGLVLLPIVVLTGTNILGVRAGKWTQNVLTTAKVLGLGLIVYVGFAWGGHREGSHRETVYAGTVLSATADELVLSTSDEPKGHRFVLGSKTQISIDGSVMDESKKQDAENNLQGLRARVFVSMEDGNQALRVKATVHSLFGAFSLALLYVLWTYAGWHEAAYVTAEVRDKRRIVPAALLLGTFAVIVLYLLINIAYLMGLGYAKAGDSVAVASDLLKLLPGEIGERTIGVLIVISSLGAINGMIFTSSRIYSEFGSDHTLFALLGHWSRRFGTPMMSLLVQGAVAVTTIILVATFNKGPEGFRVLMAGTSPVFYLFFLLTGLAFFALRMKDRNIERPFSVPLYPLTPLLCCAIFGLMFYGSIATALEKEQSRNFVVFTLIAVLAGLPLFWISQRMGKHSDSAPSDVEKKVPSGTG